MGARIVASAGPLSGAVFPLVVAEICVGRDQTAGIFLEDRSASRRHCLIRRDGARCKVLDLESRNGTFVNGLPVTERYLEDGDEIRIGNSLFKFEASAGDEISVSTCVTLQDEGFARGTTVILQREDAAEPSTRNLSALLRISREATSVHGLEPLQRKIMELMMEFIPAGYGAILLAGEKPVEFSSTFGWHRGSGAGPPIQINRDMVNKALREGVGVLNADASLPAGTRAAMAVPLEAFNRISGVIYLAATDASARFDSDLLPFMMCAGTIAAMALENVRHLGGLENENRRLRAEIDIEHNMVGDSPRMRAVCEFIAKVAPTNSTVLVCGESGTGKELVARAIHRNSTRSKKPFLAINCAALPEGLLESELFGHEKGAFTGAVAQKKGKLEEAEGGTVFLDEVGELAPTLQTKLLRVLQEREFERLGGTRSIHVDIRFIAATNRDLEEAVRHGTFRRDLYYRLNVVSLTMPPLRERRGDVPKLASYFLQKHSRDAKRKVVGISDEALACLSEYHWPGNVRELENLIERAVVLGSTETILPEDLPEAVVEAGRSSGPRYHQAVKKAKQQLILETLEQTGNNHAEAARLLGLDPSNLHRLIRNLNLRPALKK